LIRFPYMSFCFALSWWSCDLTNDSCWVRSQSYVPFELFRSLGPLNFLPASCILGCLTENLSRYCSQIECDGELIKW
jgi:hypothetical protein